MNSKKLTVYPRERALTILGRTAPALNQSVECWARVVAEATEKLPFSREEWLYLADCTDGAVWDAKTDGAQSLGVHVGDAERYDGLSAKWGVNAEALGKKIQKLSFSEAWSAITALQFFWEKVHCELLFFQDNHLKQVRVSPLVFVVLAYSEKDLPFVHSVKG